MGSHQQNGYVFKKGGSWFVRYRDTVVEPDGSLVRKQIARRIASSTEFKSKKSVKPLVVEYLFPVNTTAQPIEATMTGTVRGDGLPSSHPCPTSTFHRKFIPSTLAAASRSPLCTGAIARFPHGGCPTLAVGNCPPDQTYPHHLETPQGPSIVHLQARQTPGGTERDQPHSEVLSPSQKPPKSTSRVRKAAC